MRVAVPPVISNRAPLLNGPVWNMTAGASVRDRTSKDDFKRRYADSAGVIPANVLGVSCVRSILSNRYSFASKPAEAIQALTACLCPTTHPLSRTTEAIRKINLWALVE